MPKPPGRAAELLPLDPAVIDSVRLALDALASVGWLQSGPSQLRLAANHRLSHPPDPLPGSETLYIYQPTGEEAVQRPFSPYPAERLGDYDYGDISSKVAVARPAGVRIPDVPLTGPGMIWFRPVMPGRHGTLSANRAPVVGLGLTVDELARVKIGSWRGNVKQIFNSGAFLHPWDLNDHLWHPESRM